MKSLLELFEIKEAYRLPDAIMEALFREDAAVTVERIKTECGTDFRDVFQEEQGDRKSLKQDFTPDCVANIVSKICKKGSSIDMCSGTGTLSKVLRGKVDEYELSERTIPFALLDACVNGLEGFISRADCLRDKVLESYELISSGGISIPVKTDIRAIPKVDNVVMNPPYSMQFSDAESIPIMDFTIPKSKADYGFLLRGLEHINENGRVVAILPHGILFRGGAEGKIREWLVTNELIRAVIGLPDKLFLNTSIPVCIIVLERDSHNILFIDASKDYEKKAAQNDMTAEHIEKVVKTFENRTEVEKYAHLALISEIEKNQFNLNIPRYVDNFEPEPLPDAAEILKSLKKIDEEEAVLKNQLYKMLNELQACNIEDEKVIKQHRTLLKPKKKTDQLELEDLFESAMHI